MKHWCVENRNSSFLIYIDDTAKIAVGQPGCPEATTQHMKKALTTKNVTLESSDHNFHCASITPSVDFTCYIPDAANDSLYRGQIYVNLKDRVLEPSNPLRHVAELLSVLRSEFVMISP